MAVIRSAVLRGALALVITLIGLVLSWIALLWWGASPGALLTVVGIICGTFALGWLYATGGPSRFENVSLTIGFLAVIALYFVSGPASQDIVMTMVGVDAEAVVDRTWTTRSRGSDTHHCTLRRTDGTPIPHEFASDCEGHERGDTISVVLDPRGRFAPVDGPKTSLPVVGESQVAAVAGLVLLASIAIGAVPARTPAPAPARRRPPKRKPPKRKPRKHRPHQHRSRKRRSRKRK